MKRLCLKYHTIFIDYFLCNVLAAIGNKIIYHKSWGYADIEHNVRNRLNTKFIIGSITKRFIAFAILMLEEQGKLGLDEKVEKYLPDFSLANRITFNHLLTNTSGMFEYTALLAYENLLSWNNHLISDTPLIGRRNLTIMFKRSNGGLNMEDADLDYLIEIFLGMEEKYMVSNLVN